MATFPSKVNYATGDILTATNMNDVGGAINLLDGAQFAAGKNKILNGDFTVNQRGITSTGSTYGASGVDTYTLDRWLVNYVGGTATTSVQTFTPGAAPVAGYVGSTYSQTAILGQSATGDYVQFAQKIEDVRTLAGQTATVSFWAKATAGTPKIAVTLRQNFGSGGSPSAQVNTNYGAITLSTSWTRYTATISVPSLSGKTIGTTANTSSLQLLFWLSAGSDYNSSTGSIGLNASTIQFWGVQVEAASTASNFQTATGTKAGELAACRYYYSKFDASTSAGNDGAFSTGLCYSATIPIIPFSFPQMRVRPSFAASGTFELVIGGSVPVVTALGVAFDVSTFSISMTGTVTGLVAGQACVLRTGTSTAGVIELSAEL
jgi:hypothetical protein